MKSILNVLIAAYGFISIAHAQFDQNATYNANIINQRFLTQFYNSSGTGWDRGSVGQNLRWSASLNAWEGAWGGGTKDFALIRFGNGGSINFYNNTGAAFSTAPYSFSNSQMDQFLAMSVDTNGRLGIGTPSPIEKLDVNGNINIPIGKGLGYAISTSQNFTYSGNTVGVYSLGWANDPWNGSGPTGNLSGWGGLKFFTENQPRMAIDHLGNVAIGTTNPGSFKLAVEGKIGAREVQVTLANPWPDYVFEKDYKLTSLEDIKNYIDQNKHLPEVPSAKEMEKNGVQLGEMNMLLLKKIEELTLYMIELKRENEGIKAEMREIKSKK